MILADNPKGSVWRRLYSKAVTAAAYAVAEKSGKSPEKDCNVCDKEKTKIDQARSKKNHAA